MNPTGPQAAISSLNEGTYIAPGEVITLDGSQSWDADEDIIQYIWREVASSGTIELANDENFTDWFPPGQHTFTLTVRDSRGVTDTAWVNITVGKSNPVLSQLTVNMDELEGDIKNDQSSRYSCRMLMEPPKWKAVSKDEFRLAQQTMNSPWLMMVQAAMKQRAMEPTLVQLLQILEQRIGPASKFGLWMEIFHPTWSKNSCQFIMHQGIFGIFGLLGSTGITALVALVLILALVGGLYVLRGKRRLAADLELIESWGGGMGAEQMFDLGDDETAPKLPDMEAEAPPAMSDFGEP